MSDILIQNKGELPLWGIRLMGLSDKNEDQIGQFGTGLKEAIALLFRLGSPPTIFSGTTRVDFRVGEFEGQEELEMRLSDSRGSMEADKWYGMGIHPDMGHRDWQDPWMALREFVSNALDAGGFHREVVSTEPEGVQGATRIYVPGSMQLLATFASLESRMLVLSPRQPVHAPGRRLRILPKADERRAEIFHKGVWVQSSAEDSLFDYELNSIQLNESRSADWYGVNSEVCHALVGCPQPIAEDIISSVMAGEETYERHRLTGMSYIANVNTARGWQDAFHSLYGGDAVVCVNDRSMHDRIVNRGYKPVVVEDVGLRELLTRAGARCHTSVLTAEELSGRVREKAKSSELNYVLSVWSRLVALGLAANEADAPDLTLERNADGTQTVTSLDVCYVNGSIVMDAGLVGSEHYKRAVMIGCCLACSGAATTESGKFLELVMRLVEEAIG